MEGAAAVISGQTEPVTRGRRNPLYLSLPIRLRAAREAAGLGVAQLSQSAGMAHSTCALIEGGRVPQLDTVEKLARVLRVSPCWLAYNVEAPPIEGEALACAGVGERLRQVREARGLSKTDVAAAAGVTRGMLLYIERGQSVPSVAMVEKIAKALKVDPCWLSWAQGAAPPLE